MKRAHHRSFAEGPHRRPMHALLSSRLHQESMGKRTDFTSFYVPQSGKNSIFCPDDCCHHGAAAAFNVSLRQMREHLLPARRPNFSVRSAPPRDRPWQTRTAATGCLRVLPMRPAQFQSIDLLKDNGRLPHHTLRWLICIRFCQRLLNRGSQQALEDLLLDQRTARTG